MLFVVVAVENEKLLGEILHLPSLNPAKTY